MMQQIRGRYAPSPTGDLHMGNVRTALLAWLFARAAGGQFVLRIEDLDQPRVRAGSMERLLEDLRWLGLDWDEGPDSGGPFAPYVQSERIGVYEKHLRGLMERGLVYACYCSRAEIAQAASIASAPQMGVDEGPRYAGTCRQLSERERRQHESRGRRPALRLRVDNERVVSFTDLLAGPTAQQVQRAVGDFIVRRSDGIFAYQFAVVVDDGLMQINQVVRGADLHSSTARQILLYEMLGFPIPEFAHVPLLLDDEGKRLSKRTESSGLAPLRAAGASAEEIVGQLAASCGLQEDGTPVSAAELVRRYEGNRYDIMRPMLSRTREQSNE